MIPHVKNVILASADQVAIDAIAAKMMGYDPMKLDFIRLAHEDCLIGLPVLREHFTAGSADRQAVVGNVPLDTREGIDPADEFIDRRAIRAGPRLAVERLERRVGDAGLAGDMVV